MAWSGRAATLAGLPRPIRQPGRSVILLQSQPRPARALAGLAIFLVIGPLVGAVAALLILDAMGCARGTGTCENIAGAQAFLAKTVRLMPRIAPFAYVVGLVPALVSWALTMGVARRARSVPARLLLAVPVGALAALAGAGLLAAVMALLPAETAARGRMNSPGDVALLLGGASIASALVCTAVLEAVRRFGHRPRVPT